MPYEPERVSGRGIGISVGVGERKERGVKMIETFHDIPTTEEGLLLCTAIGVLMGKWPDLTVDEIIKELRILRER